MVDKEMLEKLDHRKQVRFAIFCARQVIGLVKPEHKEVCLMAIEAAEGWIEGRVTTEQCWVAAYAARAAADAARAANVAANAAAIVAAHAAYAAYAAAIAARAAADAADYVADAARAAGLDRESIISEQIRYYEELLNFDAIVEEIVGL